MPIPTIKQIAAKLVSFGERQFAGELKAARYIEELLRTYRISYVLQPFNVFIPKTLQAELFVDGKPLVCAGTSFVSGRIDTPESVYSSLLDDEALLNKSNINFNPRCRGISISYMYWAPSVAIAPKDVARLAAATSVQGRVVVKKIKQRSQNILVGNLRNPQAIVFCHYDSIGPGAIDNASGSATCIHQILRRPELLKKNLFVVSGNEELSYDKPKYWGHGYRVFEKKYNQLLTNAKRVIIVDCVGYTPTEIRKDPYVLSLGFPIKRVKAVANKALFITAEFDALMRVYQSPLDLPHLLKSAYLTESERILETYLIK